VDAELNCARFLCDAVQLALERTCCSKLGWWSVRERIGQGLREVYEVPKELPPELLTLVRKLDDSDWLFPSVGWQNDADLLFG
jgi:hypothetical protein